MKKVGILLLVIAAVIVIAQMTNTYNNGGYTIADNYVKSTSKKDGTPQDIQKDLVYYQKENGDVMMIITLQNQIIPVMNDEVYFRKNLNNDYDSLGTPYISSSSSKENLMIMGHSSNKHDLMFTELKYYLEEDYGKENNVIRIEDGDGNQEYELIGSMSVDLTDDPPYLAWIDTSYRNKEEFINYVEDFQSRSNYEIDSKVNENDKLLTLVTCDREYDDARIVVLFKAIN